LVTLSASLRSFKPPPCYSGLESCPKSSPFKTGVFFFSIYLVALGQGGQKPCLQAFGADQFDEEDPEEKQHKSSFFNWWYFGICIGTIIGVTLVMYIQDNVGWGLGFGIPAMTMAIALFVFMCGTRFYRHKLPGGNPLTRIAHVFVATIHKWNILNKVAVIEEREVLKSGSSRQYLSIDKFR